MAIFSFFGGKKAAPESKMPRRNQVPVDMTMGLQANEDLFEGLLHGTYQGAQMMGLPTPKSKDEATQIALDKLVREKIREINIIKRKYLNVGTTWVYPKWDSSINTLVWKIIKDSTITDLMISLLNERLYSIIVDEQITITTSENTRQIVRRKTTYIKDNVTVTYSGATNGIVKDVSMKNIAGTLPVMFAHEPDDATQRGHAVCEPILCDLKDYHDIDTRISKTIAGFVTKQVQSIKDIATWRKNNGVSTTEAMAEWDVSEVDLIFNIDGEKTEYLHLPGDATAAGEKALERIFWKIYQATGVDEMFWGGLASGNFATADNQMQNMINKVKEYRAEIDESFRQLFIASLRLLSITDNYQYDLDVEMGWNRLSSISEKDQMAILQQFSSAMAGAVTAGAIGIKQLYALWSKNFPDIQYKDENEFKADLVKTANLQQFLKQDAATGEDRMSAAGDNLESIIDEVNK
jgi:hypothetical protein